MTPSPKRFFKIEDLLAGLPERPFAINADINRMYNQPWEGPAPAEEEIKAEKGEER